MTANPLSAIPLGRLSTLFLGGWLLAVSLLFTTVAYAENEAEYQARLEELAQSIKVLQIELNKVKDSKSSLQHELKRSEVDIGKLSKKASSIKEALAREKKRLNQLQSERTELDKKQRQQQQSIATAIRQVSRLGQDSRLKLLLNQEDPELVSRLVNYHGYIVTAHQQEIDQFRLTVQQLNAVENTIISSTDTLKKNQASLINQQRALKQSQQQRRSTLQAINASLREKGRQLSTFMDDRQHLQDLLDEATSALANLSLPSGTRPFKEAKGALPMPTSGKIIYRFGSTQFEGKLKRNGILIGAAMGTNIVSVHHGRVIFSDYLRGHGLLMIIDHGEGYMSLYGHNESLLKETGEWVTTGDNIATVGNSGGQHNIGLYFEIRYLGQPQNPRPWLQDS